MRVEHALFMAINNIWLKNWRSFIMAKNCRKKGIIGEKEEVNTGSFRIQI